MAEPVSSIVTLATVSLSVIRELVIFIQDARVIDALVLKLQERLRDLRKIIKVVKSTCESASSNEEASRYVRDTLKKCDSRLQHVRQIVEGLAARKSGTFIEKAALKYRSDRSKKEIEDAVQDIDRLITQMNTAINCWNLHVVSTIERRGSELPPVQQVSSTRTEQQTTAENETVSPLCRTWSEAETACEANSPTGRTSLFSQNSRLSISSGSSRPRQDSVRSSSIISESDLVKPNSDWVDFHYQIKVCEGNEARAQEIRAALVQHPESSRLANSTDSSKRSPLHLAAQRGDVQLAQILLDFSADINAKDSQPSSVLDLAVAHNHEHFVAFLLEQNVDETSVSKKNRDRFEEMKDAIDLRRTVSKPSKSGKSSKPSKDKKRSRTWSRTGVAT